MATMADALACDMMTLATSGSCIPAIGLAPRIAAWWAISTCRPPQGRRPRDDGPADDEDYWSA